MSQQENSWYYGLYGTERNQGLTTTGQPVFDTGLTETSDTATSILVDHPARVWWQHVQHFTAWTPPPPQHARAATSSTSSPTFCRCCLGEALGRSLQRLQAEPTR
jgi:hypothetical protein